jgi:hypothetical protein
MEQGKLKDEMNFVASVVTRAISGGRSAGLSHELSVRAALVGVLSEIRVEGLDEDKIFRDARREAPRVVRR